MVGAIILIVLLVGLVAFDLAAWRWGVDTTDAFSNRDR